MASYGIGPARIVAAAVEQFADEHGISWPRALAPFAVHLVALGKPGTPERDAADACTRRCCRAGVEVLYDDRDLGPGEKFADAELLGCPLRLTVGRRSLESGEIEVQLRRGRAEAARRWRSRASPRSCCARWTSCGRASPRAPAAAPERAAPVRTRPLRAAAAADAGRPAAAAVDAAQRDRLRAPGADPRVPDRRALQPRRRRRARGDAVRGHRLGRLRRRHRRAGQRPVQPPGRADGPRHRPPARDLRRRRDVALRAVAALGARAARRARALDARDRALRPRTRRRAAHQLAGAARRRARDGVVLLRHDRAARRSPRCCCTSASRWRSPRARCTRAPALRCTAAPPRASSSA